MNSILVSDLKVKHRSFSDTSYSNFTKYGRRSHILVMDCDGNYLSSKIFYLYNIDVIAREELQILHLCSTVMASEQGDIGFLTLISENFMNTFLRRIETFSSVSFEEIFKNKGVSVNLLKSVNDVSKSFSVDG